MLNKFVIYLKIVNYPQLVFKISQSFPPLCTLLKFLNLNVYRKSSSYLYESQISGISKRYVPLKRLFVLPSLLTLSFSIPFFEHKRPNDFKKSEIVKILKEATIEIQSGNIEKAEELLYRALKCAEETNYQEAIIFTNNLIANLAFDNGSFEKAEAHFVYILRLYLKCGQADDHNDVVEANLKLAQTNSFLGNNDKAMQGFEFCVAALESKLKRIGLENVDKTTLDIWGMCHDWFARFLLKLTHYDRAKEHFKRAYDVYVKVKKDDDPDLPVLLNDIGSVCYLQQNYDEAIEYFTKAIDSGLFIDSEELASFYINLGTVHLHKKDFGEAERSYKTAMKVAKKFNYEEAVNESMNCLETLKDLKNSSIL